MDVNVKSVPRREEKSAIVGCLFLGGGWGRVDWGKPPKQMVHRPGAGPAGVLVVLGFQGSFHDTQQWVPSPCIDCCTTSTVSVLRSYSDNPPATPPVSSAFVLHCEKKTLRVCCVSWLCLWMRGVLCPGGDNIMLRRIHIIAYWFSFCQQSYKFPPPPHHGFLLAAVTGDSDRAKCHYGEECRTHGVTTCTSALHLLYSPLCSFSRGTLMHFFCHSDFYECRHTAAVGV